MAENPATERHITQLIHEMTEWTSIDVRVRIDQEGRGNNEGQDFLSYIHYIETHQGNRFLEEASGRDSGDASVAARYYRSGGRCANVTFDAEGHQNRALISKQQFGAEHKLGNTERPTPLVLLHVGKVPIYEALADAEPLGPSVRMGRPCDQYLFRRVRWGMIPQDFVYSLDRATSIPLEVASYYDDQARNEGRPAWVWRAKTLDEVDGYHVPLASEKTAYRRDATGSLREVDNFLTYTLEKIDYDQRHPASTFWPKFQPGVKVIDDVVGRSYTVGQEKADRLAAPKTVAEPIRALPEPGWTAWLSSAGLILGASILALSALLWLRRGR